MDLSSALLDTCWGREVALALRYPNTVFFPFVLEPDSKEPKFIGGTLVMFARACDGSLVALIRGFNPLQYALRKIDGAELFEQFVDQYLAPRLRDATIAIPRDPRSGMAQTNRPEIFAHQSLCYHHAPYVAFNSSSDTTFNGYVVSDRCVVVRGIGLDEGLQERENQGALPLLLSTTQSWGSDNTTFASSLSHYSSSSKM